MKGLLFLYHYSKTGTASSIQNRRFVQGLKSIGVQFDVVTKHNSVCEKENNIYKVKSGSIKLLNSILLRILPDLKNLPDLERFFWTRKVIKGIENKLKIGNYNWIHTTGTPHSVHFIGRFLKKKYNIPWVAQFYDPWTDSNFRKYRFKFFKNRNLKYEKQIVQEADFIIHSNKIIYDIWVKRYGDNIKNKMQILPFCTDNNIKTSELITPNKKYIILHTGAIYDARSLDDLINALKTLKNTFDVEEKLEIHLLGHITQKEKQKIIENKLEKVFKLFGRKSYDFVIEHSKSADCLLLIDNNKEVNVFFPSKICEYFSHQKPIIGIVPKVSISRTLLAESNHYFIEPGNTDQLAKYILELINNRTPNFDKSYYKNFLPEVIASTYKNKVLKNFNKNGK